MSLVTLLGAGPLMTTQAGAQSIAVVVLAPSLGYGVHRWLDAVIGCALGLLVATVAPSSPLRKPAEVAAKVVAGIAETLDAAAQALAANDEAAAGEVLDRAGEAEKIWSLSIKLQPRASPWPASRRSAATNSPRQLHWPTCMSHLITRAEIFGCWFGGVSSGCGAAMRCQRHIKT
jgi:hypothetical protein